MGSTTRHRPNRSGAARGRTARRAAQQRRQRRLWLGIGAGGVVALVALFVVFRESDASSGSGGDGEGPRFDVGAPGPGEVAPAIELPSTDGGTWRLADAQGQDVLVYFQEGLMCQPCWDQITDIEDHMESFEALGVDQLVSITSDPLAELRQKVTDEGIRTPVLADEGLSLADDYSANQYGMMGTSRYGHSFILVGADGRIRWRADYGGEPDYTMFVAVDQLLDDLRTGQQAAPSSTAAS